ncbi:hypothetical protein [Amycolatopsis kentuckyensis]|uniref:hypothetical protein n=1 Tax=Amycolatopsis kentuckyensis TaxID=218823 RepID=UPI000A377ACD|nr:hypothetical protein [Amycolatopsis kentuckyensis]
MLGLQCAAGNRAVSRLLGARRAVQRQSRTDAAPPSQSAATSLGFAAYHRYFTELNQSLEDPSLSPGFVRLQREVVRRMTERIRRDPGLADRLQPILLFARVSREVDADAAAGRPAGVPEPGRVPDEAEFRRRLAPFERLADDLRSFRHRTLRSVSAPGEDFVRLVRENESTHRVLVLIADRLMDRAIAHIAESPQRNPRAVLDEITVQPEIRMLVWAAQAEPLDSDRVPVERGAAVWPTVIRLLWGFVPVLGDASDLAEALAGIDTVDGHPLSQPERGIMMIGALLPFVPGHALRATGEGLSEAAARLAREFPGHTAEEFQRVLRAAEALSPQGAEVERLVTRLRQGDRLSPEDIRRLEGAAGRLEAVAAASPAGAAPAAAEAAAPAAALGRAQQAAAADPGAAAGLRRLLGTHGIVRSRRSAEHVLAAVPPEHTASFLRLLGTADLGPRSVALYQALARTPQALRFLETHGRRAFLRVLNMQRGSDDVVKLARAVPDLERLTTALATARRRGGAAEAELLAGLHRRRDPASLDRLLTAAGVPRPPTAPALDIAPAAPGWPNFLARARERAVERGERGVSEAEFQHRAALLRALDLAEHSDELRRLPTTERVRLLDEFDRIAQGEARMDEGWTRTSRGALAESLFMPRVPGRPHLKPAFRDGHLVTGRADASIPDYAIPAVTQQELSSRAVEREHRYWVEFKSSRIDSGPQINGFFRNGRDAATAHLGVAAGQTLRNLPGGHALCFHYARDPGEATRNEMMRILFADDRIRFVRFGDHWYDRTRHLSAGPR